MQYGLFYDFEKVSTFVQNERSVVHARKLVFFNPSLLVKGSRMEAKNP